MGVFHTKNEEQKSRDQIREKESGGSKNKNLQKNPFC